MDQEKRLFLNNLKQNIPGLQKTFTGTEAYDVATGQAAQQAQRWTNVFNALLRNRTEFTNFLVGTLRNLVSNSEAPAVTRFQNQFFLSRDIPLILKDIDEELGKGLSEFPGMFIAYILPFIRNKITNLRMTELNDALLASDIIDFRILSGDETQDILKEVDKIKKDISENLERQSKQVATADILIDQLDRQAEERKTGWEAEKKDIVAGIRREALEFTKIETSVNLWSDKAKSHMTAFYIATAFFVIALIAIPVLILFRGIPFVVNLAKQFSGNTEFLGLALLVIPAIAVGWLLRFIGRIAIQNLGLAHDARQRHAQITTYLRLLGDERQPISKNERILALSALFRPLPGQGSDDVSPPTVAELLREAGEQALRHK